MSLHHQGRNSRPGTGQLQPVLGADVGPKRTSTSRSRHHEAVPGILAPRRPPAGCGRSAPTRTTGGRRRGPGHHRWAPRFVTGKWTRAGGGYRPASGLTCPGRGEGQRQPRSGRGPGGLGAPGAPWRGTTCRCDLPSGRTAARSALRRARCMTADHLAHRHHWPRSRQRVRGLPHVGCDHGACQAGNDSVVAESCTQSRLPSAGSGLPVRSQGALGSVDGTDGCTGQPPDR
jgi:hypothetical protein